MDDGAFQTRDRARRVARQREWSRRGRYVFRHAKGAQSAFLHECDGTLLGLVPLGSAQLIINDCGLTGHGPTMDQPFLTNKVVPAFDAPGGSLLCNLQGPVSARAAVDLQPEEEMFRTLATKTTGDVSSRDRGVIFDGIDLIATATALNRGLLRRGRSEHNGDHRRPIKAMMISVQASGIIGVACWLNLYSLTLLRMASVRRAMIKSALFSPISPFGTTTSLPSINSICDVGTTEMTFW